MKRYELAYQIEIGQAYNSCVTNNYKQALREYCNLIGFGCEQAIIIDNLTNRTVIRYDRMRSERNWTAWH